VQNGLDCEWMDTREVLIVNPSGSNQVDPDFAESEKRLEEWFSRHPSKTIVATGFIASTQQNIPTTLKRDGSDFSAAIMGALVRARQVTIWTDVDGVYSADPRKGLLVYLHLFFFPVQGSTSTAVLSSGDHSDCGEWPHITLRGHQ